jgi:hypothetical protein
MRREQRRLGLCFAHASRVNQRRRSERDRARVVIVALRPDGERLGEVLVDEPRDDELSIHAALESWGRWCRPRWMPKRCGSAEALYRAPLSNLYDAQEPRAVFDAVIVEQVNAGLLLLAPQHRRVLLARYFERRRDRHLARMLGVSLRRALLFLRESRLALKSVLEQRGVRL